MSPPPYLVLVGSAVRWYPSYSRGQFTPHFLAVYVVVADLDQLQERVHRLLLALEDVDQ